MIKYTRFVKKNRIKIKRLGICYLTFFYYICIMDLKLLHKYESEGLLFSQKHPSLPLTIWNYSDKVQYEGLWDETLLQCRGLVTDDEGNVVARPFKKFFNMEEGKHNPKDTCYDCTLTIGKLTFGYTNWSF